MNSKVATSIIVLVTASGFAGYAILTHSVQLTGFFIGLLGLLYPLYIVIEKKISKLLRPTTKVPTSVFLDVPLSLFFSISAISVLHSHLIDDAGFLLRYLNNFSNGYFYHFNVKDAPVFGISSFSYGLFTGILCMTRLFTPMESIRVAEFIGLFFVSFLVLKTLRRLKIDNRYLLMAWVIILASSESFLNSSTEGLETSFHIAIVLSCVYFFIADKPKPMWLMLAIAIVSKLDAVPVCISIGLIYVFQNKKNIFPLSFSNKTFRTILIYFVLPIVFWIAFAICLFGSPLPQSAYAKLYYYGHPGNYWFPFLLYFINGTFRAPWFAVFILLFLIHGYFVLKKAPDFSIQGLIPGISFVSLLILYYFYNPAEKMSWYYALPDLFLVIQSVISFFLLCQNFILPRLQGVTISLIFILIGITIFPKVYGSSEWIKKYLDHVDGERIYIGQYISKNTTSADTIVTFHGLLSYSTQAYVIDMSGLNSKLATHYGRNLAVVINKFRPLYAVSHGDDSFVHVMDSSGYSLDQSFYDITDFGHRTWRLFKRPTNDFSSTSMILMPEEMILKGTLNKTPAGVILSGATMELKLPDDSMLAGINFGVKKRAISSMLKLSIYSNDSVLEEQALNIGPIGEGNLKSDVSSAFSTDIKWLLSRQFSLVKNKTLKIEWPFAIPDTIIDPVVLKFRKNHQCSSCIE